MSEQSILTLGINVDSFNDKKKAILNDFINTFEKLEKYDGKVFNPILGDGLKQFNQSIKDTGILLDELNLKLKSLSSPKINVVADDQLKEITALKLQLSEVTKQLAGLKSQQVTVIQTTQSQDQQVKALTSDYQKLTIALQQQALAYKNSVLSTGVNSIQSKALASEYAGTKSIIDSVNASLVNSTENATKFGKGLTTAFSQLRILAYILPGIGIAGIFNLAFEAIGEVVSEMGLFENSVVKTEKSTTAFNESLSKQVSIFSDLIDRYKELDSIDKFSLEFLSKNTDQAIIRGTAKDITIGIQISDAEQKVSKLKKDIEKIFSVPGSPSLTEGNIVPNIEKKIKDYENLRKELDGVIVAEKEFEKLKANRPVDPSQILSNYLSDKTTKENIEATKKRIESELSLNKSQYDLLKKVASDYYKELDNLNSLNSEKFKFDLEQKRKLEVESGKSIIDAKISLSEKQLNADISSEIKKVKALESIRSSKIGIAELDFKNVDQNTQSTLIERQIAETKKLNDIKKINLDIDEKIAKLREDYRQKRLTAQLNIDKDEVENEAIKNERIFKNDTISLEERLSAYSKYIARKQTLQDLEYSRAIDVLSLKANDPTAKKQIDALESNRDSQKLRTQADVERQVYEIVKTSLQKKLSEVINSNKINERENVRSYTKELEDLNKSFEQKLISYKQYKRKRDEIDKRNFVKVLDEKIVDDESDIKKIQERIEKLKELKKVSDDNVETAKINKDYVEKSGDGNKADSEKRVDTAVGENKAINEAIDKANQELEKAETTLENDKLARAKRNYDELISYAKEYSNNYRLIIDELYRLIKNAIDSEYEKRLQRLRDIKAITDELYQNESKAVEKSSLDYKNKTALEIQLDAEKQVSDKNAAIEERKIKRDQAIADKQLAISRIIWNTADAVSAALILPPPFGEVIAAQRAILGALQVATVIATPIPSYADGTDNHPGGFARYGESGAEVVKEPYKSPYLVLTETVSYLPKGTEVIPIKDSPSFEGEKKDDGWDQIRWLASQMKKNSLIKPPIVNNSIKLDIGFELYKHKKIYGE